MTQRRVRNFALDGIGVWIGDIPASVGRGPDEGSWLGLGQLPSGRLLSPMMGAAKRRVIHRTHQQLLLRSADGAGTWTVSVAWPVPGAGAAR